MKKILLLTASAILLLASCQKSEVVVNNDGLQEISFQSYSGRELTKAALNSGSFNVTAYKQDNSVESLYYSNVTYTWNNTCFASDPAKYWPSTGKLDFYAVMPSSLVADKTVAFNADGSTDFSAAYLENQTNSSNPKLTFGHKLTKVAFKAVGADTRLMYEITGITLTAKDSATFTIKDNSWGTLSSSTSEYPVLSSKDTIPAGTTTAQTVGVDQLYLLPANAASLNVKYNIYENGQKIDDGAATSGITVDLSSTSASWAINSSYVYTLTLNLTSSAKPVTFTATTTDWDNDINKDIEVVEDLSDDFDFIRDSLKNATPGTTITLTHANNVTDGTCNKPITIPAGVTLKLVGCKLIATKVSNDCMQFINFENGTSANVTTLDVGIKDSWGSQIIFHGPTGSTVFYLDAQYEKIKTSAFGNSVDYSTGSETKNLLLFKDGVSFQDNAFEFSTNAESYLVGNISGNSNKSAVYIYKRLSTVIYTTLTSIDNITIGTKTSASKLPTSSGKSFDGVNFTTGMYTFIWDD